MTIQESKDTNINRHISTERYNESLVLLMNSIARSVYTFSYNRSLGIHSTITVDDEVFSFISCLFPLNENSIKEIDDIIGHHNFYSLCEYTIKFNVDIKNILTKFANLLRDALKIAYIDAPLLTEIRS
jgi:hypothetical protein